MQSRIAIRVILTILILGGISGYAWYESKGVRNGPLVRIDSPINGRVSNTPVTDIRGSAQNIVKISMNDHDISVDEAGNFNEKFVLSNGNNVIKVNAQDRFGRKTESLVEVVYNEPSGTLGYVQQQQNYQ